MRIAGRDMDDWNESMQHNFLDLADKLKFLNETYDAQNNKKDSLEMIQAFDNDPRGHTDTCFGVSLSISDDELTLVVGGQEEAKGIFIYSRESIEDTFTKHSFIERDPEEDSLSEFGVNTAISNDSLNLMITDANAGEANRCGIIHFYSRENSKDEFNLIKSFIIGDISDTGERESFDFGKGAAISGDFLNLVAYNYRLTLDGVRYRKEVHSFTRDSINDDFKRINSFKVDNDKTGEWGEVLNISKDGLTLLISDVVYEENGEDESGAVFIYNRKTLTDSWELSEIIQPDNLELEEEFGRHVYISDDRLSLYIGASEAEFEDDEESREGTVYKYTRKNIDSKFERSELKIPRVFIVDPEDNDKEDNLELEAFGTSFVIGKTQMIISAPEANSYRGIVLVYNFK